MKVHVDTGWSPERLENSRNIVQMVSNTFESLVGQELGTEVHVVNIRDSAYPMAHYEKLGSSFLVTLSCSNDDSWCQIAYQLAHELCHLYSNHSQSYGHKHKWLEESICEAASIATLNKLGAHWQQSPLANVNAHYGNDMLAYIKAVHAPTRTIKFKDEFKRWLAANLQQLESNPTQRPLNNVVAKYLYNRLFSLNPDTWRAIRHLNHWDCHENATIREFGESWLVATPDQDKPATRRILELLCIPVT